MGQMIADQVLQQVVMYFISTLLSSALAAGAVGGVLWRKLHVNDAQNQRMDALTQMIKDNEKIIETMCIHQLEIACDRAAKRGCISMKEKQDITALWDLYNGVKHWNGKGEVAYKSIQPLPVKEDC